MDTKQLMVAAMAIAATLPGALAWGNNGQHEPDTRWDRTEGRMFTVPDQANDGKDRVYFNGLIVVNNAGLNPNVGGSVAGVAGETRLYAYGSARFIAYLGIWKDCNKDGYIGNAESALIDYPSALLSLPTTAGPAAGASVCPVTARTFNDDPVHNDGTWVKEFLFIGMADPCAFQPAPKRAQDCGNVGAFARNPDVIYVNGTKVWSDFGWPGDPGRGTCPVTPLPRGTTSSTGGALFYVDCVDGRGIARNVNDADDTYYGKTGSRTGLRFENPNEPQKSTSLLNQNFPTNLWGNPYTKQPGLLQVFDPKSSEFAYRPAFSVQDCSQPRKDVLRDPTAGPTGNGTLNQVGVKAPAGTPQAAQTNQRYLVASANASDNNGVIFGYYGYKAPAGVDPTGSYIAGVEDANDAAYIGALQVNAVGTTAAGTNTAPSNYQSGSAGDCDRNTNNTAHNNLGTSLESSFDPQGEKPKYQNAFTYTFFNGARGISADVNNAIGSHTWPADGGANLRSVFGGPMWNGLPGLLNALQVVDRYTQKPMVAQYNTYYAYVPPAAVTAESLTLPAVSTGKYGSEACATIGVGQPPANGWNCAPGEWWLDVAGNDGMPYYSDRTPGNRTAIGTRVGDDYTLRDVDCYDGRVGGVDSEGVVIYASLVQFAPDPRPCQT